MGEALAVMKQQPQNLEAIEQALVGGNLGQLTLPERLSYYKQLCESLGLNHLTQPFEYLQLNGKLRLYAKKDATDQLRKIHGVSVTSLSTQKLEDVFVVTANGSDRTGRTDSATGAVTIGNKKGDDLANCLMKAETKAKRRLTLSLCGLGFLDETEIETIHNGRGPAVDEQGAEHFPCDDCKGPVKDFDINGKHIPAEALMGQSQNEYGVTLCGTCFVKRKQAAKVQEPATSDTSTPSGEQVAEEPVPDPVYATLDGDVLAVSGTVTHTLLAIPAKKTPFILKLKDGMSFSTFHKSNAKHLQDIEGERVSFTYSINGEYRNIEKIIRIGDTEYEDGVPVKQLRDERELLVNEGDEGLKVPF